MSQMPMPPGGMPPQGTGMPPGMPMGMPPGMPQMGGMGGAPGDGSTMTCPCCGQAMPMPMNMGGAPNVPVPPGQMGMGEGLPGMGGENQDSSALLMAILGAGGGMGGMR